MPAPTPSFDDIKQQLSTLVTEAEAKVMQAKNDERAIRLRINQLGRQVAIAQDNLTEAQQALADAESASSSAQAEIGRKVAEAQQTLDTLLADIEPARRRHDNLQAEIERLTSAVSSLSLQKQTLDDDIATLTTERETLTTELAEARKGKDTTLANLSTAITKRSDELQAFDVKQETMRVEHQRKVDELLATEKALTESNAALKQQENDLLSRNATLQHEVAEREAEVQELMANLKRRENDLDARERAVKNKERSVATQLRRNLT